MLNHRTSLILLASGLLATTALGQFEIPWWTVDGGGGASSGGGLTVIGTIGQADAGASSGALTAACGFWPAGLIACYANCDVSTVPPVLNVQDFACYLNRFASGDSYANCDHSTTPPVLNVQDFACFLNQFAAGCP